MPKEEWGVKRLCPKCNVRFYDLQKDPMTCPSCGAEFDLASLTDTGNKSAGTTKAKAKEAEVAEPVADIEDAEVILDDDDAVPADDDLLDDDDDTVALEEIADVPATEEES